MGKSFYPDAWAASAFDIDYQKMYDRGFRGIIYDIDNTLVYPNAPADERAAALFQRLRDIGFRTVILSNNTGKRALTFAEQVASPAVTGALKPCPGRYRDAVTKMGIRPQETFFVGDQIYTDIWGANNAGLYCILTLPLTDREEFWIRWKRLLERPVITKIRKTLGEPQRQGGMHAGST